MTKSSQSIWHYVVSVKSTVKISSIFVAFLENMNFTTCHLVHKPNKKKCKIDQCFLTLSSS